MARRSIDAGWLRERYPRMTCIDWLLDDHEAEFGWRPTRQSVYVRANRMGLRKEPVAGRADRAERTIRWTREPEMEAWMLEHDRGQRMDDLQAEWRGAWGFGISRGQVNLFRASHGMTNQQVRDAYGEDVYFEERPRKHRYVYFNAPRKRRKRLRQELRYDVLPYPKGDAVHAEDGIERDPEHYVEQLALF